VVDVLGHIQSVAPDEHVYRQAGAAIKLINRGVVAARDV
jgi:hypothetical protein